MCVGGVCVRVYVFIRTYVYVVESDQLGMKRSLGRVYNGEDRSEGTGRTLA